MWLTFGLSKPSD